MSTWVVQGSRLRGQSFGSVEFPEMTIERTEGQVTGSPCDFE